MATVSTHSGWHGTEVRGPEVTLAGAAALAFAAVLLAAWAMPFVPVLPLASLALLTIGLSVALAFWQRTSSGAQLSYLDVAGLLVFSGCAAAMLSDVLAFASAFDAAAR